MFSFRDIRWAIALPASMTTFSRSGISMTRSRSAPIETPGNEIDVHSPATFRSRILGRDDRTCRTFTRYPGYSGPAVSSVAREYRHSLKDFLPRADGIAGLAANVVTVAGAVGSSLILPALGTVIGTMAFQFLRSKYQKG